MFMLYFTWSYCKQLASNVKLATRKYKIISRQLGSFEVLFSRPAEVSVAMASGRPLISVPGMFRNLECSLAWGLFYKLCILVPCLKNHNWCSFELAIGVLPLNMGNSRKERMGKYYVNTKWIPTLLDKK